MMFDGPEYTSYIAFCRELRLAPASPDPFDVLYLEYRSGGSSIDVRNDYDEHLAHLELVGSPVWLPRLDQWLAMLEEAGWSEVAFEPAAEGGFTAYIPASVYDLYRAETRFWPRFMVMSKSAPTREGATGRLWVASLGVLR